MPIKGSWPSGTSIAWNLPSTYDVGENVKGIIPGSIGQISYYPNKANTLYQATALSTFDSGILFNEWNRTIALNDAFEARKAIYETKKSEYDQ